MADGSIAKVSELWGSVGASIHLLLDCIEVHVFVLFLIFAKPLLTGELCLLSWCFRVKYELSPESYLCFVFKRVLIDHMTVHLCLTIVTDLFTIFDRHFLVHIATHIILLLQDIRQATSFPIESFVSACLVLHDTMLACLHLFLERLNKDIHTFL